jgi:hypothetical protein
MKTFNAKKNKTIVNCIIANLTYFVTNGGWSKLIDRNNRKIHIRCIYHLLILAWAHWQVTFIQIIIKTKKSNQNSSNFLINHLINKWYGFLGFWCIWCIRIYNAVHGLFRITDLICYQNVPFVSLFCLKIMDHALPHSMWLRFSSMHFFFFLF